MDLEALSGIALFTANSKLMAAAICLVAVFIAWYTVRSRIQFSQVILGIFSFVVVMIFSDLLNGVLNGTIQNIEELRSGEYVLISLISVVLSRELVRFVSTKFVLGERFHNADAAIGFGLGFGAVYVLICAVSYFFDYTTLNAYLTEGADAFFASFMTTQEAEAAYESLLGMAFQDGWAVLLLAVNRVFYLIREIALCLLIWYGFYHKPMGRCLILVPVLDLLAWVPDSLYNAGILTDALVRDVVGIAVSGLIAGIAAYVYNKNEDQVSHFKVERLRARRRR